MTQAPPQPTVTVKPNPNVYTALLLAAIVVMVVTVAFVLRNLMSPDGYALQLGDLFGKVEIPQ
jgi:hypothetical protein